jgi:hypothetical protein
MALFVDSSTTPGVRWDSDRPALYLITKLAGIHLLPPGIILPNRHDRLFPNAYLLSFEDYLKNSFDGVQTSTVKTASLNNVRNSNAI